MATIPPPKLKAYLGKVKEEVLDGSLNDVNHTFQALVLLELVQRGILPQASHEDDPTKVVEAIRATAGKAVLDGSSSSFPKPLLAGSSAVAGMIAEKCAALIANNNEAISISPTLMDAMSRCKDVEDERLVTLLSVSTTATQDLKKYLLHIAEGYFLRAASFQPDPPQMWKKALDAIVARSTNDEEPLEAALPLEHLIRIAESKKNQKRVSELSLRQSESWLSTAMKESSGIDIENTFVAPFRPNKSRLEPIASEARKTLQRCTPEDLDDDGILWYQLVALRIELEDEVSSIESLAQEKLVSANNRGINTSLETCRKAARSEILIESIESISKMESVAIDLRTCILQQLEKGNVEFRKFVPAIRLIMVYVDRLQYRSKAAGVASLKEATSTQSEKSLKSWSELSSFLQPILQCLLELSKWRETDETKKETLAIYVSRVKRPILEFFELCALTASTTAWMTFGWKDDLCDLEFSSFLSDLLSCLDEMVAHRYEERKAAESRNTIVSTKASESEVTRNSFQSSSAAMLGLVQVISNIEPTEKIVEQALSFSESIDKYANYAAQFGMSYMLFLNAWSGLQHAPWSYCNITQARAVVKSARSCLQIASKDWGRQPTVTESLFLDLAEADMEGGFIVGGLRIIASKLYHLCMEKAPTLVCGELQSVIRAHCLAGLSRLALTGFNPEQRVAVEQKVATDLSEHFARCSLEEVNKAGGETSGCMLLDTKSKLESAKAFHKSLARQLVADSLVRAGRPNEAEAFLEAAVQETPEDFDAALALGGFRLRMCFYPINGHAAYSLKAAQSQLLKAAKLNSSKASPFALLGYWYERNQDAKRAVGCYARALVLDSSHPVAGRGILRLKSYREVQTLCEDATNINSPLNGWAWKAVGFQKAMYEGDDEMAVICYQEALRCLDISSPHNESMSSFYAIVLEEQRNANEVAGVWAELAGCYRRLGRYSAAIRAFDSAWSGSQGCLPPSVLTGWAQVQLELGLVDDAAEKFGLALEQEPNPVLAVASYGLGCALLSVARRDANDGKAGSAYCTVKRAISVVEGSLISFEGDTSTYHFRCAMKLLGDMFTFGAMLPPDVFADQPNQCAESLKGILGLIRSQISFIAKGEKYYQRAEEACAAENDVIGRAAFACDVGSNMLLQAQYLSISCGEGHGTPSNLSLSDTIMLPEVQARFDQSSQAFRRSIEDNPLFAPAWCGLGCAVLGSDPLLAQHSFTRAIEIDKSLPDAWANLGFLYAARNAFNEASMIMDELTQVADTPMMWICRAAMLEREAVEQAEESSKLQRLSQANDAYKAALQVTKEPVALLGIGMTCHAVGGEERKRQSYAYFSEFAGATASRSVGVALLHTAMAIEDSVGKVTTAHRDNDIKKSICVIDELSKGIGELFPAQSSGSELWPDSKAGLVDLELVSKLSSVVMKTNNAVGEQGKKRDLQIEIMLEPTNGMLWLDLAKNLTKDMLLVKGKNKRLVLQAIEGANTSCDRAVKILTEQITSPSFYIKAADAADACALAYCARKTAQGLLESLKNPPECESPNPYNIQRALILCPDNRLAREVLCSE